MLHCFLCETIQLNYKIILFPSLHVLICSSMVVSTSQREHQSSYGPWSAPALLCLKNHENGRTCRTVGVIHSYTDWRNFGILRLQDADWDCFFFQKNLLSRRNSSPNLGLGFFLLSVCDWFGGRTSLVVSSPVHNASFVINYPLVIPNCLQ